MKNVPDGGYLGKFDNGLWDNENGHLTLYFVA